MPVKPSIGLWYQTINPKSVRIGPCQFNNDWLKQENIIGIDPEIKAIAQFFLSSLVTRYCWNPIKTNIWGIQFDRPKNIKYELKEGYEFGYTTVFGKKGLTIKKKNESIKTNK